MTLAPFDRFPTGPRFPLYFRFNQPVAPADRTAKSNFESVTIHPHVDGNWAWMTDSDLRFEPMEGWKPRDTFRIALKDLRTAGADPVSAEFNVTLPAPEVNIARCELELTNRAPVIQAPRIVLRANYVPEQKVVLRYVESSLILSGKEERLAFSQIGASDPTVIDLRGPQLLRPQAKGEVVFRLKEGLQLIGGGSIEKGTSCSIQLDPDRWDDLLQATQEAESRPPARIIASIPARAPGVLQAEPSPLRLEFQQAWSRAPVAHHTAKGSTISSGITISPAIEGVWTADEHSPSALLFTPAKEWPVGQELHIAVDPAAFPQVNFKGRTADIRTPRLEVHFQSPALYQSQTAPTKRRVSATVRFSHPVTAGKLQEAVSLRMRVEPVKNFTDAGVRSLAATVQPDEKNPLILHVWSEDIDLPKEPGEVSFNVAAGLVAEAGGAPLETGYSSTLLIPSEREIFRIASFQVAVVKRAVGLGTERLERVLSVETSEAVATNRLLESLQLHLLPDCGTKENRSLCKDRAEFGHEQAVLPEVMEQATALTLSAVPRDESVLPTLQHFTFDAPEEREVLALVKPGVVSDSGFALAAEARKVLYTERLPRALSIMHEGSLLSLSGSRKLGVSLRNITDVEYELARVLPHDLPHLLSVMSGNLSNPEVPAYRLSLDQLSERFTYTESFPGREPGATHYSSVDFSRFLGKGASPRGLFLLTMKERLKEPAVEEPECDEEGSCDESESAHAPLRDRRLVLLTDLGVVVKDGTDGVHDVFVLSFRSGAPVVDASVKILGQNGIPVLSATTDQQGRVRFPDTRKLRREKVPLAYVVEKGGDYSFLPFQRMDRLLNVSRFETGGVYNSEEAEGLRAMLFSDRGIYRPGEEARVGVIVRQRDLEPADLKLPLEMALTDPRGVEILRRKFALSALGFEEFRWSTLGALTGTYQLSVYLIRDLERRDIPLLGSTTFRVDEFQPDKLAVKARYFAGAPDVSTPAGWQSPEGTFEVSVKNLFGTAAVANKVRSTLLVRPWNGIFPEFPGFRFYTAPNESSLPPHAEDLGESDTDQDGKTRVSAHFDRYAEDAYLAHFTAEAFEKESGRSVVATSSTLLSKGPWFLGWKADGSLDYIARNSQRSIELRAVSPTLSAHALSALTLELEEIRTISTLVKQPNGALVYEMAPKRTVLWQRTVAIPAEGTQFPLATDSAGRFNLTMRDETGRRVGVVPYVVAGETNANFLTDRMVEVGIQLSKDSVEPGEEIELALNTPYAGSGLITIERDKVYAAKWFQTSTNSSVQRIVVPRGIVGNAYVSVAFVRSLESRDLFAPPLSYGVKPFSIARSEYAANLSLKVPEKVRPGAELSVEYQSDTRGKFLLFAVDEGILQFARYRNPEVVSYFVPKRALEVQTFQILDLLLPDHKLVEALSSPGGSEDVELGRFKNPFARKRRAPMAFWSGIIDGTAQPAGVVSIPVPEHFNGTIRVIGVVVGDRKFGTAVTQSIAQGDFVIDPQLPYFLSPGDEFEVGATIANTIVGSGRDVPVTVDLGLSDGLEFVADKSASLNVPEGEDVAFRVRLRARDVLGEQTVRFTARGVGREQGASETLSVRPARLLRTELQSGRYEPRSQSQPERELKVQRTLYSQLREVNAFVSFSPLSIGRSLVEYLKQYPYGCTEQLVSMAFPAVVFGADAEMGLDASDVEKLMRRALRMIAVRQLADGSIGLWEGAAESDPLFSVYVAHFLQEAAEKGFDVPALVHQRLKGWLTKLSAETFYNPRVHLAQSYALYLRARGGEVVSREVQTLIAELDRQWQAKWRESAIAFFIAGTLKQLQLDMEAEALLKTPGTVWEPRFEWPMSDAAFHLSTYNWIAARHFAPERWLSPLDVVGAVASMIGDRSYNSFTASFSVLGLQAAGEAMESEASSLLSVSERDGGGSDAPLHLLGKKVLHGPVGERSRSVHFKGPKDKLFFYELVEKGIDAAPSPEIRAGLDVKRELRTEAQVLSETFTLQDKVEVTLFVKADQALTNVALVELIPGGFELDLSDEGLGARRSLRPGPNSWSPSFIDVQEDRIIFFGDLAADTQTFTYRLKPLSRGKFAMAAPYAEAMYDTTKRYVGKEGVLEVQ